jgi:molybdenum cofactor biosynthesis protein B
MMLNVIVVSTSRFQRFGGVGSPEQADDLSGLAIMERVAAAGHEASYSLLPDGERMIRDAVLSAACDAVVICGGTGLAPLDLTIEAVEPLYNKAIPGFGEIFRHKSMDEIGTRAILTRCSAGVVNGIPVFCLPGSPSAATLGIDLILLELGHILKHIREG